MATLFFTRLDRRPFKPRSRRSVHAGTSVCSRIVRRQEMISLLRAFSNTFKASTWPESLSRRTGGRALPASVFSMKCAMSDTAMNVSILEGYPLSAQSFRGTPFSAQAYACAEAGYSPEPFSISALPALMTKGLLTATVPTKALGVPRAGCVRPEHACERRSVGNRG